MNLPHAVILAGGRGERLGGVRKADLRLGGRRLLDRVADALGDVAPPLMVSTGPQGDWRAPKDGILLVPDLEADMGGPLAGLAAAVASLQARGIHEGLLVSAAVDTPFLPIGFTSMMAAALHDAPCAYAAYGGQFYPPNAIWRIEALASLPDQVRQNTAPPSLKALQQATGAHAVHWATAHGDNPFANINTVADLVGLARKALNSDLPALIHTPGN